MTLIRFLPVLAISLITLICAMSRCDVQSEVMARCDVQSEAFNDNSRHGALLHQPASTSNAPSVTGYRFSVSDLTPFPSAGMHEVPGGHDADGRRIGTWRTYNGDGQLALETTYEYPEIFRGVVTNIKGPTVHSSEGDFHVAYAALEGARILQTWNTTWLNCTVEFDHPSISKMHVIATPDSMKYLDHGKVICMPWDDMLGSLDIASFRKVIMISPTAKIPQLIDNTAKSPTSVP